MKNIIKILLFGQLLLAVLPLRASLSAVVTPGYQFPLDNSVQPTFQLLNELATPTIQIYGTIGGSNTLAPGSITTVSFAGNVYDNVTIGLNGNSPGNLQVLANGIAGGGLTNSSTTVLQLYLDPNYFLLATNSPVKTNYFSGTTPKFLTFNPTNGSIPTAAMWLGTNSIVGQGATNYAGIVNLGSSFQISPNQTNYIGGISTTGQTLVLNTFVSPLYGLGGPVVANTPHGFTNTPVVVNWVVVCQTPDATGYAAGDEVPTLAVKLYTGNHDSVFNSGANATNVFLIETSASLALYNKTNGVFQPMTIGNWSAKCYARP